MATRKTAAPKATARKTTARKAAAPKAAPKAAAPKVAAKASNPLALDTATTVLHAPALAPYAAFSGSHNGAAYTIGSMVAAGLASLSKAGTLSKGKAKGPGAIRVLRALVGARPISYHREKGNIDENGLTAAGVTFFHNRMNAGTQYWTTTADLALEVAAAIKAGGSGKVEVARKGTDGPVAVPFTRKVLG